MGKFLNFISKLFKKESEKSTIPIEYDESYGAIVWANFDEEIKILLLNFSHGFWGFPKGHADDGESPVTAAIREIYEETGLEVEIDENFVAITEYPLHGNTKHPEANGKTKRNHYFAAEALEVDVSPKDDGEVIDFKWCSIEEAKNLITYEMDKEIFNKFLNEYMPKFMQ